MSKIRRTISFVLAAVMILTAVFSVSAAASEIRQIGTKEDLLAVNDAPDGDYKLICDIDFEGLELGGPLLESFSGTLDGCGFEIKGLNIKTDLSAGLIGTLTGSVKNLAVKGSIEITENSSAATVYVGAVAAVNGGNVENVGAFVDIKAAAAKSCYIGGITGTNMYSDASGRVSACISGGSIVCTGGKNVYAGGISGAYGSISSCTNNCAVKALPVQADIVYAAGIAAFEANIDYCLNTAAVDAVSTFQAYAGGIAAFAGTGSKVSVLKCENSGAVTANVGGVSAIDDKSQSRAAAGGIIAYMANTAPVLDEVDESACTSVIGDVKNSGAVSAAAEDNEILSCAGGIAGIVNGLVFNAFNITDDVIAAKTCGPVYGAVNPSGKLRGKIRNSFYAENSVSYAPAVGNDKTVAAVSALSAEQLLDKALFDGFDFENTWSLASDSPAIVFEGGHEHIYRSVIIAAECEKDESVVYTCAVCGDTYTEIKEGTALGHDWDEGKVTTEPTCETKGEKTFTCKNDPTHTYTEDIEALGHDWDDGEITTEPTCETKGEKTFTCKNDETHTYTEDIEALGHDWDAGKVTTEPTCETKGEKTFTCKRDETHTYTEDIEALGHDWDEGKVTTEPTCKTEGVKTLTCKRDEKHTKTEAVPVDPNAHKWGEYVYNNDATTEKDGTKTAKCEYCDATDTVTAEGTKLDPGPEPEIKPEPEPEIKPEPVDSSKKFIDVEDGRWYKEYIDYVATYGLMNGMTENTFAPTITLSRAMFVQILANLSGVDTSNSDVETQFKDVPAGKWFTPAVKWAADNKIVNGISPTEFKPSDPVQRQQMCAMLVRYTEYAKITLTTDIEKAQFGDDARIQDYAKEAVYACQQAGIIDGMDKETNTFAPRESATRAQVATIMTRFHKNFVAAK